MAASCRGSRTTERAAASGACIILSLRIARRFGIIGRVQGVGFRYFVEATAAREGVTGYVRNLPDGSVEVYAEGEAESVVRLERAVHSGPGGARVTTVHVADETPGGAYNDFTIR